MKTLKQLNKEQLNTIYESVQEIAKTLGCKSNVDFLVTCLYLDEIDPFCESLLHIYNLVLKELYKIDESR